jgi:phage-related holin
MSYRFSDVASEIQYHLIHVLTNFRFKAILACIPSSFSHYFGGNWHFVEIWFALNVIDLFLGVALALKTPGETPGESSFSRAKLYGWITKSLTHICTILLFGVMTIMLSTLSGYTVPLVDWFLFVLVLTETASILSSADQLGLPVHPLAKTLVQKLRKRAETKIDDLTEK